MTRAVHHSSVWLVTPLWVLLVFCLFGRVGILVQANQYFAAHARVTQGLVLKKFQVPLDHFSSTQVYGLRYSYAGGNIYGVITTQVDLATFDRVRVGGPIPIGYLPEDPRRQCIAFPWEFDALQSAPLDDFVVGMLVFVPGVLVTWYFARRNRIHARLLAGGAPAWGEITELKKTHTRQGSYTYLVFRFAAAEGREIIGRSTPLPESEHHHWQTGDPIHILFDPKNPHHFAADTNHPLDGLDDDKPAPVPIWQTIWA